MASAQQQVMTVLNQFYQRPVAQVSLELFLSLGAVVFFALFAIRPTLVTMSDLIKEIEDKRKLEQQLTQKVAALSTAQTQFLTLQDQLIVLEEALPSQPYTIEALKIVEKLASENNLIILTMSVDEIPEEVEAPSDLQKRERKGISISLGVTGDYLQIRQFIESLLDTRRTFIIDTIVFSAGEERGEKSLKANITLSLPYFAAKSGGAK